ncbi:MAG: hypothetical protein ACI94Z_002412, partial [Yoonia sp.]
TLCAIQILILSSAAEKKLLSVTKIMLGVSGRKVLYQSWTVTINKLFSVTVYTD